MFSAKLTDIITNIKKKIMCRCLRERSGRGKTDMNSCNIKGNVLCDQHYIKCNWFVQMSESAK